MTKDESLTVADMATLGRLLEEHRPNLLAMVQRRIDPSLAARIDPEDVLSEAFLEARRKWNRFKGQSAMTPYAWLYRIVLDSLVAAWRRETRATRDPRQELPWPERSGVQLGLSLVAPGTSPSKAVAREELQHEVRRVMECLSDRDQEILWMRVFDQLSFREAAMVLGVTANAAAVRYARALRRLKELWIRLHENGGTPT
jgi:RNA polymerase sigma-70 factor, ECF subfamily